MIKKPGKKLKIVAIIIFAFYGFAGIFVGFWVTYTQGAILPPEVSQGLVINSILVSGLMGLLCALIGIALGWINSIMLYAVGALVDDVETIKEKLSASDTDRLAYTEKPTWMK